MAAITGIVLAAGAGTRAGGPKALLRMPDGTPWLVRATTTLLAGGCERVVVVLGAQARLAAALVPHDPRIATVIAQRWASGMSESLKVGLAAASGTAALVTLVDLPGMPVSAVARLVQGPISTASLRQAVFGGRPGHPVLIGRDHWTAVAESASGDRGARTYLLANSVVEMESGDLFDGLDVDTLPKTSVT